jgi:leucyl-tRNA synthetase
VLHRTIDGVRADTGRLRFNTAIAKLIELNNHLTKLGGCPAAIADQLVLMLAPLAPHMAEELWAQAGPRRHGHLRGRSRWPTRPVPGRRHDRAAGAGQRQGARASPSPPMPTRRPSRPPPSPTRRSPPALDGNAPKKVIVVPGRTVNIVV